jgi:hypothetical protein
MIGAGHHMPYLYCEQHGREREATILGRQDVYRQADEAMLVASGMLTTGPWQCNRCAGLLRKGDQAILVSAFPSHFQDELHDYDFGYERQYFAMTAYGAEWPDDSIRNRRKVSRQARPPQKPLRALDLLPHNTHVS